MATIGDIVKVEHTTNRMGLVVAVDGTQVGIRYFKSSANKGAPTDHVWWIHRTHVRVISAS